MANRPPKRGAKPTKKTGSGPKGSASGGLPHRRAPASRAPGISRRGPRSPGRAPAAFGRTAIRFAALGSSPRVT